MPLFYNIKMSHQASALHQHQRKTIRRAQIHSYFSLRRQMMLCISKEESMEMLIPHLEGLRKFAIYQSNAQDVRFTIQKIEQVMRKYDCLDFLIRGIDFGTSKLAEMKFGSQYREMTCIDVLIYILNAYGNQLDINAECSYILSKCAEQFKIKLIKKRCFQNKSLFQRQFNRLVEGFPFSLVLDNDPTIVINVLSFIAEVSLACNNGVTMYYLVNKLNPNIVLLINCVIEKQELLSNKQVRSELMRTAVTLVYYIARYNYVKFEAQEFIFLTEKVKEIILNSMLRSDQLEEFNMGCWNLNLLFESGIITLIRHELDNVEGRIEAELRNNSLMFFCMLKKLMTSTRTLLKSKSIGMILLRIFDLQESTQEEAKLKATLISIYHYQVINGGGMSKGDDIILFVGHWGEYTKVDKLLSLLRLLDDFSEEKGIDEMMTLLTKLFSFDQQPKICDLIDMSPQQCNQLFSYEITRTKNMLPDLPIAVDEL